MWRHSPGNGLLPESTNLKLVVENITGALFYIKAYCFSWTDEGFHWIDDTPFQYEKWNLGEPNSNGEDDEDCVQMYTGQHDGSYWSDENCDNFNPFMCKVEQGERGNWRSLI